MLTRKAPRAVLSRSASFTRHFFAEEATTEGYQVRSVEPMYRTLHAPSKLGDIKLDGWSHKMSQIAGIPYSKKRVPEAVDSSKFSTRILKDVMQFHDKNFS